MKRVAQSVAACALAAWLLALLGSAVPRVVYAVDRSLPTAPEMMAPLTEQEALAAAFARPERQQQWAAKAQRAQAGLDRARTWSNPTLSFSRERIDDALGVPTERSLVLSKDFDLSGRRALDIDAARASRDAASLGVASSQADARAEVRRRFQDAVLGAARLEAQVAQQRDFAHLAAAAVARSTAGDLSALEARRIELRLAEAEVETARRLGEHDRARAALALMIGEALARHPLAQAPLPTAMLDAEQTKSDTTGSRVTQYAEAR